MSEPQEYKKLPGNTFDVGRFGKFSLWLTNDHLLHVRNRGDSEEYKRFYYHDIQSLLLRKTSKGTILNVIFGILSFACLAILALAVIRWKWQPFPLIAWSVMTAIFLFSFLSNVLRGGTCTCHLQTAVHHQELRSLSRIRASMKALALVIERVEQTQGFLSPEHLLSIGATQPQPLPASGSTSPAEIPKKYYGGNAHWVLFGLMILQGLQTLILIFYRATAFYLWTSSMSFPIVIAMILAIIRQRKSTLPGSIINTVWVSLATYVIVGVISYFYTFFYAMANMNTFNPWETARAIMELSPLDSLPWLIVHIVKSALYILLGSVGLILVLRYRRGTSASGEAR